ncbi:MAG: dephospho-CoA kinase [Burkholderiaceae bacterium]
MNADQACPVVVLTGGIGSGKSTVAGFLEGLGVSVVDADAIVHELTGPEGAALAPLKELLGENLVSHAAGLDRAKVRQRVFADPDLRKRLEALLHPMVQREARQQLDRAIGPYCLYVVPLWAETYGDRPRPEWVWRVVVVDVDEDQQRARVLKRTPMNETTLDGILAAQASRKRRLALADHVIHNHCDEADLIDRVRALHSDLVRDAREAHPISSARSKPMADRP